MICTKCGKDSGEFPFCPYCGEKMQNQSAVWRVGMPCPHCGGLELEGDRCAFCGVLLVNGREQTEEALPYESLFQRYGSVFCGIQLAESVMKLTIRSVFKTSVRVVAYHQLREVTYYRTDRMAGHITFRWQGERREEFVDYCVSNNDDVGHFFVLLFVIKSLSPPYVQFRMGDLGRNIASLPPIYGAIDWDDYFQRFAPYRNRAVKALCRDYALEAIQAWQMVHIFFEERQLKRYERDTQLAVQDMLLLLREKQRLDEEKKAELEEYRAIREKYKH